MENLPRRAGERAVELSRRGFLVGSLLGGIGSRAGAGAPETTPVVDSAAEIAAIQQRASEVKLRRFRASENEHYLAVGDAPDPYRERAQGYCTALATAYMKQFRDKGFAVKFPAHRLTIITLKDKASYQAFLGETVGQEVGGHYDLDTNRLVVFDFRPDNDGLAAAPERINTFTLVHEAIHQLTFNTGLLERLGDVPLCISEGLATYGELWQAPPRRVQQFGPVNRNRLDVIRPEGGPIADWIALDRLLVDDELFANAATAQLAYAQGWLLVFYFIRRYPAKFRAYLDAIKDRRTPKERLADAKKTLGPIERLDKDLSHYAGQVH